MRAEYEVRQLPDSFVTIEKRYTFVDDEKVAPDRWGRKRQRMVVEEIESRGGWLYVVRGKPGHSIRLTSLDQIKDMKLTTRARMIDDKTGEEVDERGIPLSVSHLVSGGRSKMSMSGPHGTDVDVEQTGDSLFEIESGDEDKVSAPVPDTVEAKIAELE